MCVFECDIAHRRSVAILCMLYKIRCKPIHLNVALPLPYVLVRVTRGLWSLIGILMPRLATEPRSIAGLLFPSLCPSGTILPTPYSMVWDWRVSRAGSIFFYGPKLLYPYYCLYYCSPSLLPVYWLGL